MHTFLLKAVPANTAATSHGHPIFVCVARGTQMAAEATALGELHRAGWKVLEVSGPEVIRQHFPGLKHHPTLTKVMAEARERGLAFLVLEWPFPIA